MNRREIEEAVERLKKRYLEVVSRPAEPSFNVDYHEILPKLIEAKKLMPRTVIVEDKELIEIYEKHYGAKRIMTATDTVFGTDVHSAVEGNIPNIAVIREIRKRIKHVGDPLEGDRPRTRLQRKLQYYKKYKYLAENETKIIELFELMDEKTFEKFCYLLDPYDGFFGDIEDFLDAFITSMAL
jgi:hypothetical protein